MKYKRTRQELKVRHTKKLNKRDLYNLDLYLARIIADGVRQFKKANTHSLPNYLLDNNKTDEQTMDEWHKILDDIIWTFNEIANNYNSCTMMPNSKEREAYFQRIANGKQLFIAAFDDLWD